MDPIMAAFLAALGATATFGVGWVRERRKGKRDANVMAIAYIDRQDSKINSQNLRIDELTLKVGELLGRVEQLSETNRHLMAEKAALVIENTELKAEILALKNRRVRQTDPH